VGGHRACLRRHAGPQARWPEHLDGRTHAEQSHARRFHLDFYVDDLVPAEAAAQALGALTPQFQPGGQRWRVLTDPAGHPFCLCVRS
jgi:hypothetical protein